MMWVVMMGVVMMWVMMSCKGRQEVVGGECKQEIAISTQDTSLCIQCVLHTFLILDILDILNS